MAGGDSCRPLESTDDCEVAAWWPDSAGERLMMEPLRRGGEDGGEDAPPEVPPEWDTDATSAAASATVLRRGEGGAAAAVVLVVELRRQSRRLRPLAVEVMLIESESRTRSGVRNCAVCKSGYVLGLPAATVKARVAGVGVGNVDVGDDCSSFGPATMCSPGAGGLMVRPAPLPPLFACAWEFATWLAATWGGTDGVARGGAGVSVWFRRERERERETTLRTRSRRLPVDEEGVRGRELPWTPSEFLNVGVGAGMPLSVCGGAEDEEWSRLAKEGGGLPRSFSSFTGAAAETAESRSLLWKEPA